LLTACFATLNNDAITQYLKEFQQMQLLHR